MQEAGVTLEATDIFRVVLDAKLNSDQLSEERSQLGLVPACPRPPGNHPASYVQTLLSLLNRPTAKLSVSRTQQRVPTTGAATIAVTDLPAYFRRIASSRRTSCCRKYESKMYVVMRTAHYRKTRAGDVSGLIRKHP
jgi:hypothetical protein